MKRPDLPADHCANQPPEMARKMFVQSIAPRLKGGSMDARSAISELEGWREYHPEVFADWEGLCWKYLQQPPEWVDWLIQGVRVTSGKVKKADDLVAAARFAAEKPLNQYGEIEGKQRDPGSGLFVTANKVEPLAAHGGSRPSERSTGAYGETQSYLLRRLARDAPNILERVKSGEIKSARAAAIEAGIITPFPSLQLKDPVPTAQKLLDKKGKEWCLQLLEELSELVL